MGQQVEWDTKSDWGTGPGGSRSASDEVPDDPEARAREVCLRLLTLAPRTRAQLADALQEARHTR